MPLNIKNTRVEQLAAEIAHLTGETKTEAIRKALEERRQRLHMLQSGRICRGNRLRRFLEEEVWPHIPPEQLGKTLTKEEEEEILGLSPDGI